MHSKKVMSIVLVTSMIVNSNCFLAHAITEEVINGNVKKVTTDSEGNLVILTHDRSQVVRYSSTDSSTSKNGSRVTFDASFIDDKRSSEDTLILGMKGFIPSGRKKYRFTSWEAFMQWPEAYIITIENLSNSDKIKIVDSLPTNKIDSKEVTESVSYTLGGGVSVNDSGSGSGSLNASAVYSRGIKYNQEDYRTTKIVDTNKKVIWSTEFTETRDGYNMQSWNPLYGNQMFMAHRYGGDSINNFTSDYRLSKLITGGFSPENAVVLIRKPAKDKSKTPKINKVRVTFQRVDYKYFLQWSGTQWWGQNYKVPLIDEDNKSVFEFRINWENRTVREVKSVGPVKK